MATREELIGLLSNYLTGQATSPSWYYTSSPAELETLYKDYIKSQMEYTDTVTPYYRNMGDDPVAVQMFKWFKEIAEGKRNAAGIIAEIEETEFPLSEEQKADLRTYESEQEKRNEAEMEKYINAEIYGLPTPDASGWDIPREMLAGLRNVQKGGMTELESSQRWLRDAQKKYVEAEALSKLAVPKPVVTETKERTDPMAWLYNRTIGQVLGDEIQERKPVRPSEPKQPTPKAVQDRNTAYVNRVAAEQAVRRSANFAESLAEEIAKQMVEKYGTPYDAAIITARRLAEEEATKKYGPKTSGGSSGLSDWEKEQERKRKLFEGRGI